MIGPAVVRVGVERVPSVIESPNATIAPACCGATTSTRARKNHAAVVAATGKVGLAGMIAGLRDVVGLQRAGVRRQRRRADAGVARQIEVDREIRERPAASRSTGSLTTIAPGGIVDRRRAAERQRRDPTPATIAASLSRSATCAAPIVERRRAERVAEARRARDRRRCSCGRSGAASGCWGMDMRGAGVGAGVPRRSWSPAAPADTAAGRSRPSSMSPPSGPVTSALSRQRRPAHNGQ